MDPHIGSLVLDGDYRFLSEAYYRAVDAVNAGLSIRPSPQQVLDTAIVPLTLIKAEQAGIPVPEWYLTNEYFRPPVICHSVNPFMRRSAVIQHQGRAKAIVRSLTRNFQYAVCCQEIEPETVVREFAVLLGRTVSDEYSDWGAKVWEVFGLPLVRVKLLQTGDRRVLSSLNPLPRRTLKPAERDVLDEGVRAFGD